MTILYAPTGCKSCKCLHDCGRDVSAHQQTCQTRNTFKVRLYTIQCAEESFTCEQVWMSGQNPHPLHRTEPRSPVEQFKFCFLDTLLQRDFCLWMMFLYILCKTHPSSVSAKLASRWPPALQTSGINTCFHANTDYNCQDYSHVRERKAEVYRTGFYSCLEVQIMRNCG